MIKPKIEIFFRKTCPYCIKAKSLLDSKNFPYSGYDVELAGVREEMVRRVPGAKTIPQIIINDKAIGGCDDLYQLDSEGRLGELLAEQ